MNQPFPADNNDIPILAHLRSAAASNTIDDVIHSMEQLDQLLPETDGVKWFNLLYLDVTRAVQQGLPDRPWSDPPWIKHLDVTFARLYFNALADWETGAAKVSSAWAALFNVRFNQDIERIQFALGGMNAHINHDLPIAVVQSCADMAVIPSRGGPQYQDYSAVNAILTTVEPRALKELATGIIGTVAQDLGHVTRFLSMWSVTTARDTAWNNAEIAWHLRNQPSLLQQFQCIQDRMTGFAGRGLLLPLV
ncbi:MAG: hypothetical protein NVS4B8_05830 [Herpetosiphon sp.]